MFYYCFTDACGPLRAYVPGHQRNTRAGDKTYDIYMVIFACAATGAINCQIMEGGKATGNAVDVCNRFFSECCVPKMFFIDKDSAFVKALSEGELDVLSIDGSIARERGILFQTCPAQGHSAHGRVERRIKMVQEAFDRCDMKRFKLTGLGWQTVAKRIENEINSIPLGYLTHKEGNMPLLRILTPNFLKLNAGANRSPGSLFTMPDSAPDLMTRIEEAYRTFYKVWNDSYVPLLSKRSKWHDGDVDLCENDIIYFKLTDSALASTWLVGKVESIVKSKDGRVRKVLVGYKFNTEQGTREFRVVERPARECVKLMSVDDTTLLDDIREVREAAEAILGDEILHVRMDTGKIDERFHNVTTCACNQLLHLDSVTPLGFSV